MPIDDDDAPPSPKRPPPRPMRPAVRAFLSRPDVSRWVTKRMKKKIPDIDHEQEAQTVLQECIEKVRWPASDEEKVLWAVLRTVARYRIADYHEKRNTRREHEGPMPRPRTVQDEAGDHVIDEEASADPSTLPHHEDPGREGRLARLYMEGAVKDSPRDEEAFEWWSASLAGELTYAQIADVAGLSESDVKKRVQRMKDRYLPGYERWRNGVFMLLLLGGIILVAVVVALVMKLREPRVEDIRPSPDVPLLVPSASGSGEPVVPPPSPAPSFDNALPTDPRLPLKPQPGP